MPIDLFTVRNLKAASGLAFCLALLPATSTHLPKTINAGFAPAMFSGFVHRKSERGAYYRLHAQAAASLSEGCRRVFGKPAEQSASAK